jgi:ectoine hydroxylase-related dioxygenase (phytanoyl-CoA dioxygenase family)
MERGLLVKHVKLTNKCLAHFKINMHVNEVTLHAEYPIVQTTPFKTHTHTHGYSHKDKYDVTGELCTYLLTFSQQSALWPWKTSSSHSNAWLTKEG